MRYRVLVFFFWGLFAMPAFAGIKEFSELIKLSPIMQGYKTPDGIRYSELKAKQSVVKGIYSLINPRTQKVIFYSNEDLTYIEDSDGWREVKDGKISAPLPKERQLVLDRDLLIANFDLDDAIVYKFGKGFKKFILITAIDCGHCRELEQALKRNVNQYNATLYLFPKTLNSDSKLSSFVRNIWCSSSPASNWQAAMTDPSFLNKNNDQIDCSARKSVDTSNELARIFRAHGTPAFISPGSINGSVVFSGFPSKPDLQDRFLESLLTSKE